MKEQVLEKVKMYNMMTHTKCRFKKIIVYTKHADKHKNFRKVHPNLVFGVID